MESVRQIKGKWDLAMIDLKPSDQPAIKQVGAMLADGWEPFQVMWKQDATSIADADMRSGYYALAMRRYVRIDDNQNTLTKG